MKLTAPQRVFALFNAALMVFLCAVMLFPVLNTLAKSFSDNASVMSGKVLLLPKGFNVVAYRALAGNTGFLRSGYNTIVITVVGVFLHLAVTLSSAYAVSRKDLVGVRVIFLYYLFTLFFNGGIIPTFMLIRAIRLYDTLWALILPFAISVYHMIIAKSFFGQLPASVVESAYLDGANDIVIFAAVIIPMSKAVVATLALFAAVMFWNTFMPAIFYLESTRNWPLQMFVRQVVFDSYVALSSDMNQEVAAAADKSQFGMRTLAAATIIASITPIVCVYPFLQRHFVKGVSLGAVKE